MGAVTLRVAKIGPAGRTTREPRLQAKGRRHGRSRGNRRRSPSPSKTKFEMEFDDGDPEPEVEGMPLADDDAKPAQAKAPHPRPASTTAAVTAAKAASASGPRRRQGRRRRSAIPPRPQARRRGVIRGSFPGPDAATRCGCVAAPPLVFARPEHRGLSLSPCAALVSDIAFLIGLAGYPQEQRRAGICGKCSFLLENAAEHRRRSG